MKKNVFFLAAMFAITSFVTAQTVVFSDNFDSYTAGSHLAQVNPAWTTWSDVSGGSDDGVISTAQAFSAPNSLLVDYGIDQVFPFNNYTSGHYMIEFKLFVPSSSPGAYFNIQHIMRGQWAFHCNFQSNGIGYVFVANTSYPFNYSLDAWVSVLIDVDLDNDQASVSINNNLVHSWPFHYSAATAIGANQLAGVNICSSGSAHMTFYVDDFVVTEVSAAQFGEFEVTPENLILNMAPNTTAAEPIVMGNPGEAATHFRVVPTYDIPNPDPTSTGVTDLHYYMGQIPYTSITFYSDDPNVDLAVCIPSSALQSHIGKTLNEIDVYFASSITNTKICVYAMNDMLVNRQPGEVVYEQPFTAVNGWNHVPLTTPYLIDGSDLWFGISYVETGSGHIYLDGFPANDYSCWAHNNNYWLNHFDGYDYNLMIGGKIDGTPITPWINMEQSEDTIAPGATVSDNVVVNTNGMNIGETHTAKLHCYSNDLENSEVVVPVTLNITGVSVNEHNQIEVTVYPNPAVDYVQVNSEMIERVEIHNMMGQKVFDSYYGDSHVVISTDGMAPGTYVVTVTSNGTQITKQVVIK
jgi:hypothetical protein